jgi:hypothetical protein
MRIHMCGRLPDKLVWEEIVAGTALAVAIEAHRNRRSSVAGDGGL